MISEFKFGKLKYTKYLVLIFLLPSITVSQATLSNTSRCPTISNTTVDLVSDKKLCNVYHECFCNQNTGFTCEFVRSQVCPTDTVFVKEHRRCEPIEKIGCETSYLHWISPNFQPESFRSKQIPAEAINSTADTSAFKCPEDANNSRFPDPGICNVFHVCVRRDNKTYDQPFLCPFSTIFRVKDRNTMYCDVQKSDNDCKGKAFYRSIDATDVNEFVKLNSLIIETSTTNQTCENSEARRADDHYCNTYHVCNQDKNEHFMCEKDLLFNTISGMCDYPINVQCGEKTVLTKNSLLNTDTDEQKILKSKMQSLILYPTDTFENAEELNMFGIRISLKCPIGAKNYIYPDNEYCNVFHHCHGFSGKVSMCEKGQAFDSNANGAEESGVCNYENLVDCTGKFLLTENGKRAGQSPKNPVIYVENGQGIKNSGGAKVKAQEKEPKEEELIEGIEFDCLGKPDGHYRDYLYCDVFHACIASERKKTYSCAHVGERNYFDDDLKRCEFLRNKPAKCMHNMFYKSIVQPPQSQNRNQYPQVQNDEYNEKWKIFIRSREPFNCIGKQDGFYASRWCNVFYRCFMGIRTEFLCPKMLNSHRLWWVRHDSSQELPQTSAACVWPCETNSKCMSPGGIIQMKADGSYYESIQEADRVWEASNCQDNQKPNQNLYDISEYEFTCRDKREGEFYPSKYCNVFHRCTSSKRTDFKCPRATNTPYDLWWNAELGMCDWPCKIKCNSTVYGTKKTPQQILAEDLYYNERECIAHIQKTTPPPVKPVMPVKPYSDTPIQTHLIKKPFPDEGFICTGSNLIKSPKYCNVYYSCKSANQPPQFSFYCADSYFDANRLSCVPKSDHICPHNPELVFPLIAISENTSPEDATCTNAPHSYVKLSQRYANVFYKCDGRSQLPKTYRCYDRDNLEDAVFSVMENSCVRQRTGTKFGMHSQLLKVKTRYQSSPVDHTRFADLEPLSCRADQQYLAEHDKFCNLYHSCILGKYQMYACVSVGDFDKTSYFYYTNGNCGAPESGRCSFGKTTYDYERLFPQRIQTGERLVSSKMSLKSPPTEAAIIDKYGPVIQIKNQKFSPACTDREEFVRSDREFCNLFYECTSEKLLTSYLCIDNSSGELNGIFDNNTKMCVTFNSSMCVSGKMFKPTQADILMKINEDSTQQIESLSINEEKTKTETTTEKSVFKTDSTFSCEGRQNGYYESEWCNVFFQCSSGERIDSRCSGSLSHLPDYDLWWVYQNATYNAEKPMRMDGSDGEARCDWPCKTKCQKKIWTEASASSETLKTYESILKVDHGLRPKCSAVDDDINTLNMGKVMAENGAILLSSPDSTGFDCDGRFGIFADPLFCNIFHECKVNDKRLFVCDKNSLFDAKTQKCVSGLVKCDGLIYEKDFLYVPVSQKDASINDREVCTERGIFRVKDNVKNNYCDLFNWCGGADEAPVYFYCDINYLSKKAAVFNLDTKQCELKDASFCKKNEKVFSKALKLKMSYLEKESGEQTGEGEGDMNLENYFNKISEYLSGDKLPYAYESEKKNKTSA